MAITTETCDLRMWDLCAQDPMKNYGRNRRLYLTFAVLVCINAALLALLGCRLGFWRHLSAHARLEEYADIQLNHVESVLREDDRWTWAFLDGTYSITVKAGNDDVARLLSSNPPWGRGGWSRTSQLDPSDRPTGLPGQNVFRIAGEERDVFKTLTIDRDNRLVCFELRAY